MRPQRWAVGVVVVVVVWDDDGGASVSCGGRVFSHDDPLPKISPSQKQQRKTLEALKSLLASSVSLRNAVCFFVRLINF